MFYEGIMVVGMVESMTYFIIYLIEKYLSIHFSLSSMAVAADLYHPFVMDARKR